MSCSRKRRGALLYLAGTCSFALLYFVASFSRQGRNGSKIFDIYPWQMVAYDEYGCGCPRTGPPIVSESQQSLCSDWSTSRGIGQRVVSYTLYGNRDNPNVQKKYYDNIEDRLREVEQFYPGFVVRLYHNLTSSQPDVTFLCHMYCKYPFFDPCQIKNLYHLRQGSPREANESSRSVNTVKSAVSTQAQEEQDTLGLSETPKPVTKGLPVKKLLGPLDAEDFFDGGPKSYEELLVGKMWRFLVMADPTVSEFLVRDVDSSILEREVAAVEQWLYNSTALVHAMRDHPSHNGLMLAGLWGGSRARGSEKLTELFWKMMRWPPRNLWDYDQILLKREVWPEVTDDVLVHDSYFCANPRFQSKHRSEPFPTKRKERYFVGWGPLRNPELKGIIKCPRQCRPVNHQDWLLC